VLILLELPVETDGTTYNRKCTPAVASLSSLISEYRMLGFCSCRLREWQGKGHKNPGRKLAYAHGTTRNRILTRDEQCEVVNAQECITQAQRHHSDLVRCKCGRIPRHRCDRTHAAVEGCDRSCGFFDRGERDDVLTGLDLGDLHSAGAATPHLRFA
jgi:hypothetical protein